MDSPTTPDEFARRVMDLGLADRRTVEQALNEMGVGDNTLDDVIAVMQRRGVITTLQTEKLLKGDRQGYFYGEYKVLYLIGAGTFARVYRASRGDEVFAVKVLRKRFRDDSKELEQFLREGRMGLRSSPSAHRQYRRGHPRYSKPIPRDGIRRRANVARPGPHPRQTTAKTFLAFDA